MKKLFSFLSRSDRGPDQQFGTGLWRHNRDRFLRAVDRYYATALAIHATTGADAGTGHEATGSPTDADALGSGAASARETIIAGTHRLNALSTEVDEITEWLHTHVPVDGQVVPGHIRRVVGDVPEQLTKASAKVAEAVLAASMARTDSASLTSAAAATERFITDAADLLARVRTVIAEADDR